MHAYSASRYVRYVLSVPTYVKIPKKIHTTRTRAWDHSFKGSQLYRLSYRTDIRKSNKVSMYTYITSLKILNSRHLTNNSLFISDKSVLYSSKHEDTKSVFVTYIHLKVINKRLGI